LIAWIINSYRNDEETRRTTGRFAVTLKYFLSLMARILSWYEAIFVVDVK